MLTKGQLIKFLEPYNDDIEIEINPEYVFGLQDEYGHIINKKED